MFLRINLKLQIFKKKVKSSVKLGNILKKFQFYKTNDELHLGDENQKKMLANDVVIHMIIAFKQF